MAVNITVKARYGESAERLIRRFSKKVRNDGLLEEMRNNMFYEKPSVKKRRKSARSRFLQRTNKTENK